MSIITTSAEKQSLLFRYIGQLEGIIEGSTLDKDRYDALKEEFEVNLNHCNHELFDELAAGKNVPFVYPESEEGK